MSWKKYFTPFDKSLEQRAKMTNHPSYSKNPPAGGKSDFQSQLPQVYTGPPNRVERYTQYDHMDLDPQVSSSLDIISEFCSQQNDSTGLPFHIDYKEELTASQTKVIESSLKKWCSINNFKNRIYDIFRNTIKYGDSFFVRDPETYEWLYIFPSNMEKITIDEAKGKTPEAYWIRDFDYSHIGQTITRNPIIHSGSYPAVPTYNAQAQAQTYYSRKSHNQYGSDSRFDKTTASLEVMAEHVVHLSMNTGLDQNFPFGTSILERVYKVFKQKELLEDSIIIYRIQRAPERRIFYIDVGDLPENRAMQFVERMKNEIHQKRVPTKTRKDNGQVGSSIMDATYNPLNILDDYYFPQSSEGRGSRVETLPGGDTRWGLDELQYFNNYLGRGLRVPVSYLPTGLEESNQPYSDGRVGTALIQELRFAKFCERIQNSIVNKFDEEFKLFVKSRGIGVSASTFNLEFNPPQNYAEWRKLDLDTTRISNFTQIVGAAPYISKRLALKEYLGWGEDKINENTEMYTEENSNIIKNSSLAKYIDKGRNDATLQDVGFNPSDYPKSDDVDFDIEDEEPEIYSDTGGGDMEGGEPEPPEKE